MSRKRRPRPAASFLIEIGRDEMARLVKKHGINAHDETLAVPVLTREMPSDDLIGNWNETPVWAIGATNSRFLADTPNPFVCERASVFCSAIYARSFGRTLT
jgi:hypothetical protein